MIQHLLILLLAAAGVMPAYAFLYEKGGTCLPSLSLPASARMRALGDAGAADVRDGAYASVNPAGIAAIDDDLIFLEHMNYFMDMKSEYLSATLKYERLSVGVAVQYFDMGAAPLTRDGGDYDEANTFHAYDAAVMLTSKVTLGAFNVGATIKGLRESIWTQSMNGIACDLGATWRTPVQGLIAGAALMNAGYMSALAENRYPLSTLFRTGVVYSRPVNESVKSKLLLDMNMSADGYFTMPAGVELTYSALSFRAGYHFLHDTRSFSAGVGLVFGNLTIDYCYIRYLDDINAGSTPQFFALGIGI